MMRGKGGGCRTGNGQKGIYMVLSWGDCMRRRREGVDVMTWEDLGILICRSSSDACPKAFLSPSRLDTREHMTVAVNESDTRWYGTDIAVSSIPTGVGPRGGWGWSTAATSARQRIAQSRILSSCTLADPGPISSKLEPHPVCLSSGIHDKQDHPLGA